MIFISPFYKNLLVVIESTSGFGKCTDIPLGFHSLSILSIDDPCEHLFSVCVCVCVCMHIYMSSPICIYYIYVLYIYVPLVSLCIYVCRCVCGCNTQKNHNKKNCTVTHQSSS